VDELQRFGGLCVACQLVAQPVFDGFHIMVGTAFDGLDRFGIGLAELCSQPIQHGDSGGGEGRQFLDARFVAQRLEPFDLDQHAVTDQAVFAEMVAQGFDLAGIAAIERGKGGEGGKRHDVIRG